MPSWLCQLSDPVDAACGWWDAAAAAAAAATKAGCLTMLHSCDRSALHRSAFRMKKDTSTSLKCQGRQLLPRGSQKGVADALGTYGLPRHRVTDEKLDDDGWCQQPTVL